ncbi:MAG: hypothetical protein ACI8P0_001445, partial [Planctomycetaceae bacterium]
NRAKERSIQCIRRKMDAKIIQQPFRTLMTSHFQPKLNLTNQKQD